MTETNEYKNDPADRRLCTTLVSSLQLMGYIVQLYKFSIALWMERGGKGTYRTLFAASDVCSLRVE